MRKLVIAITGSSSAIYVKVMLDKLTRLRDQWAASTRTVLITYQYLCRVR